MNANLQPQMPAINNWLVNASSQLSKAGIISARLDGELILAHSTGKSRIYLHAHPEQKIDSAQLEIADSFLMQRVNRAPIAYIVGHKEFYGRDFVVTPSTLIPRPESESIIYLLKKIPLPTTYNLLPTKLVDVGTGCGCLGIIAKLELPELDVSLLDISPDALIVAKQNAKKFSTNVTIVQSDLLQNYSEKVDIIIANLPYVDRAWDRSPETNHEPDIALFANDHGLSIIKKMIDQSSNNLNDKGYLILEADPSQQDEIVEYAKKISYSLIEKLGYAIALRIQSANY